MIGRCVNPKDKRFYRYGGRGITVDPSWSEFNTFRDWAVENNYGTGLHLDRIDNDGPYSPSNCRFATPLVNGNNTSRNKRITAFGETKTFSEWSRDPRCQVSAGIIGSRIKAGWPPNSALTSRGRPGLSMKNRSDCAESV